MSRIGIFGGSFDPIHVAHLVLADQVRADRRLDKVLFVPARRPPHKPEQPLAPAEHRLAMVKLAVAGKPAFEASTLELERDGPSYTLLTVRDLRRRVGPEAELFLIVGADSLHDLPTWWRADELVREVAIVAVGRPGYDLEADIERLSALYGAAWARQTRELVVNAPLMAVSSTDIRRRTRSGHSVRCLVPDAVCQYIARHGLYGRGPARQAGSSSSQA